ALSRLDRDVLSLAGVTEVVVSEGSNDIFLGADPEQLAGDLSQLAARIHAHGARAVVTTIVPRVGGYQWDSQREDRRRQANAWIRGQSVFDAVLDLETVLDDPASPGRLRPEFDADGTHPNSAGYQAMAASVDLAALTGLAG
ncbi:MAG: GDSL-type esterase/lipase family protein, partial [Propionibacteriaceae bacterium]|nr:GDSL-type esterase/lipase family protein [Propionibacteriaceae bacterium]